MTRTWKEFFREEDCSLSMKGKAYIEMDEANALLREEIEKASKIFLEKDFHTHCHDHPFHWISFSSCAKRGTHTGKLICVEKLPSRE